MSHEARFSAPKVLGADVELGNFVLPRVDDGRPFDRDGTGARAARLLLAEVPGVPAMRPRQYGLWSAAYGGSGDSAYGGSGDSAYGGSGGYAYGADGGYAYGAHGAYGYGGSTGAYDPQDTARRYLPSNGASCYEDLHHFEAAAPETTNARDFVAVYHAMLRIAQRALARAQAKLGDDEQLEVVVANSDGQGNSYGAHLNFLVTRQLWDDLMVRRPHFLGFLASHQVTSIVYTGLGKVGSENGRAPVAYQLAQRADFFEALCAVQTTHTRPIVNCRDEALCGARDDDYARLHHIFSDAGLCHVATYLKVGTTSLVLAMLEAGEVGLDLLLDDPVAAVLAISHDPTLRCEVGLAEGGGATALTVQRRLLERALDHGERTGFPTVPGADEILACWGDTLDRLETRDRAAVSDRLDWAAKLEWLELARRDAGVDWGDPELKHLDLLYSNLDPERGLYWAAERAGAVERLVDDDEIERFTHEPPEDTRAYTRAMLLRRFGTDAVERVDWDRVVLELPTEHGGTRRYEIALDDPLGHTRAETAHLFQHDAAPAASITGAERPEPGDDPMNEESIR